MIWLTTSNASYGSFNEPNTQKYGLSNPGSVGNCGKSYYWILLGVSTYISNTVSIFNLGKQPTNCKISLLFYKLSNEIH